MAGRQTVFQLGPLKTVFQIGTTQLTVRGGVGPSGSTDLDRLAVDLVAEGGDHLLGSEGLIGLTDIPAGVSSVTLATAELSRTGPLYINDESGLAGVDGRTVQVGGEAGETVDGQAFLEINTAFASLRLYTDGSNWFTF